MAAGVIIDPLGQSVVVTVTSANSGRILNLFSDQNTTAPLTNPVTISTLTKVFVKDPNVSSVSLKVNGVEQATVSGIPAIVPLLDAGVASLTIAPVNAAADVGKPVVAATDGQLYGYDAALGATRAFNPPTSLTWRTDVTNGVVVNSTAATTTTIATLVLPNTVTTAVTVGGVATLKATTAAATIYFGINETSNGTDSPVNVTVFRDVLNLNEVRPFILPDLFCYVPATGRTRTLTLVMYAQTGVLQAQNGNGGLNTAMMARSAS